MTAISFGTYSSNSSCHLVSVISFQDAICKVEADKCLQRKTGRSDVILSRWKNDFSPVIGPFHGICLGVGLDMWA